MNTKQLRQKILDLAIRGKLVPQDPNDEPASVLLERIRTEKERLVKEGKIKRSKGDSSQNTSPDKSHYGELSDGWAWATLGNICDMVLGKMLDAQKNTGEFFPYLRNANVRWFDFEVDTLLQMRFEEHEVDRYSVRKGDLVLCEGGEPGRCAVWQNEETVYIQKALHRVRPYLEINSKYISYTIYLYSQTNLLSDYFTGSTIKHLTGQSLANLTVPLPPLAEQQRIVTAIGSAFAVIDEIERNKTNLQAAVTVAKSKILSLAIRGKLVPQDPNDEPASVLLERIRAEREALIKAGKIKRGKSENSTISSCDNSYYEKIGNSTVCIDDEIPFEVPESWLWYRLSNLWKLLSGRDLTPSEYSADEMGIPYITGASNFTDGELIINRWTDKPKVISGNGDLLITCKGTVGEMKINTQGNLHIARQIMAIKNSSGLDIDFLRVVMDSFILKITSAAKGIIPGISREDLLNMLIPLPPLTEQKRIVTSVNTAIVSLNEITESLS